MSNINIVWLYPDVLSLHGDRGNVMALERCAKAMGLEPNVTRVDAFGDEIDFSSADIIVLNAGEIKDIPNVVAALNRQRARLENFIEDGGCVLVTGTTGGAFCKNVTRLNGPKYTGLGFFDINAFEKSSVYGDDILVSTSDGLEIVGCQIQLLDFKCGADLTPFGQVQYGYGNNNVDKTEGARHKNFVFTNALGPVLVKNPRFAERILKSAAERKGVECNALADGDLGFTELSRGLIKNFLAKKQTN